MKIAKRQLMGFLIALLFMCSSFVFVSNTAQAAMTQADYDSKVNGFINDARWRNGIWWGSGQPPKLSTYSCAECFAYACDFTKYVYGINSLRSGSKYTNISEIRQGDVVYMTGHYFVVLYRDGDYLYTAEGNNSSKVRIAKYGYKISNGRLYSVYGNSSYAQNFINGWHYTDIVSHTHSYASAITKQPTCTNTGIKTFTCSCGASYTESVAATGHKYVNTVVPPTTTDKGYTLHTCSVCGNSYKDSYTDPIYEEDGWYYTTVLPENVDSTSYDIQYKNYYEKIQQSSPGAGWVNAGLVESKWVNSGGTYEDYHTLQTSSSKVLVNYYYFHFCGPSAGSRVNYTLSSPYVHYDDIRNVNSVNVVSSGTDDDGTTIPYYILNWTNGQGAFCSSGTTCNGSNGTHGARSKVWYRMNVYQNRVQVNNYKFTKESDWVDAKDSTAKSTQIRYTLKNPLKAFISTDKSEASVGQNVTFRANATGGVTGYTYSFLVHNTDTNLWSRIQSFASNSTLVWKAGSAGNREFYVEVKDSTGKVTRSEAVKVKVSSTLELTTKVDKSSLAVGEKLTVTGYGKGGSGNYTYSFLIHNTDTNQWSRVQSFTSNSTLVWTAGSAGNREFYVEVKDSTGKVTRSEAVKVKVSSSALGLTTKVDKSSLAVGEKLTVTGYGKGGSGNYTYSFLIHNTDINQWSRVQSFTSNSTLVWTAGSAGNREFYVEVKDSTGKVTRSEAVKVKVSSSALGLTTKVDKSSLAVGEKLTVTGYGKGGSGNYTYSFLIHNTDINQWSRVQSFTSNSTLVWTAGSAGNREFYVEVKDSTGKVTRSEAVKVTVSSPALGLTTRVDKSSLAVGEKLTVTGYGKGGSGNYTYSFLIHNTDTNQWSRVQSFTSNSTLVWTAGSAGNRNFYVEVKDTTGKVVRSEAIRVVTY